MTLIGGRYDLQRQIGGVSGQGEVYEALDTHEGDVVAIKLLFAVPPRRQWLEARILRRLADRHILPIRNADTDAGRAFLVTELAVHGTVDGLINGSAGCGLDIDDTIRWAKHACGGLGRAHDLGLLHNDVKPGNLFLDAEGECLVGDFGLASIIPRGATTTQAAGGTFETLAPEVAVNPGGPTASVASDVYSLGATAYWMVASQAPLDLSALVTPAEKLAHVAATTPRRLFDVAPHVPLQLQAVIEKAMARAPGDRFRNMNELGAAFGACTHRPGRRWQRTDDHAAHVACFTGMSPTGASLATLCVTVGSTATKVDITARTGSGNRILKACRSEVPLRTWTASARSAMRDAK